MSIPTVSYELEHLELLCACYEAQADLARQYVLPEIAKLYTDPLPRLRKRADELRLSIIAGK